ncbi:Membrane carboxypeptidase (penicillin-binding protein) [Streptomyces sp. Ag82_O1-12]|uniref:transglycosylase domain-containing protein n=1 Tax=unclassified Streptomyces TaxID=2593676 RepID=UPI000BC604C7|nr:MULTISPECIES: transglycosylase domain-containing protein [unclassified Streptomyces]SMQ16599.1 Membrane carboxypeptidase (penicillin-binding protein) [Streptomyces sp. Ag82_O1-12]SOD45627.1 Membrane carboxypeptidase (penicillin-binding protein) [Streptomyces sp. Ag82_G6-1]
MSDEPQPQQPNPGWASREPQAHADGAPGTPGTKAAGKPKRTGWRRIIPTWRMTLGAFVIVVLLLAGGFFLGYSLVQIPPANALATKQANVYLYADGSVIARDGEVNRENVTLPQISKDAQHAILAAEDRDFYTESAVDPKAMVRAAWNTALGKGKQSGSTITQQYVKNYYLRQEQTVTRKAKEFFIAIKLDREVSKDHILEGYLNTSYFGRNAYGIQAAAQAYYGKDAKDLDPGRAAYLAALVNAPSQYDVVAHPENRGAAESRWNYVLDGMVTKGWLSKSERTGMKFPMPKESTLSTGMSGQRGYIVRIVKDYLVQNKIVDERQLDAGGYRITTTLQKGKQDAFVKAVDDKLMSKLDKKNNKVDTYVRAGGASVDPKTGKVVAMYNGVDYVKQYTPNATRRDFQVGSTFKPFVFTSAVENHSETQDGRVITPNTIYDGTNKRSVQGWTGDPYAPENEDQRSYGDITVTEATDSSVNSVYAQMAADVGPAEVKQTAIDLGVPETTPDLADGPAIALGTATASVLDMAEAYATLANHGRHGTYTIVEKVTKGGMPIDLPERRTRQAVSREAADTTTSMLQSVVQNGTASAAQAAGRPVAGKTGTAEEDTAAWFAGYTPDLATVVSVMGQDPVTAAHKSLYGAMGLDRINGGGAPAEIWTQFTEDALKNKPAKEFDLRLQPGADVSEAPSSEAPADPTTGGTTDGGTTTGGEDTGTETPGQSPSAPEGQTEGQTDGGTTDGTTGGESPTGGGTADGGTTDGGTTDGGTTDGGTTDGGGGGDTSDGGQTGGPTGPGWGVVPQGARRE